MPAFLVLKVGAQSSVSMRWAKNISPAQFAPTGSFLFSYAYKRNGRICFYDRKSREPLSVHVNGEIRAFQSGFLYDTLDSGTFEDVEKDAIGRTIRKYKSNPWNIVSFPWPNCTLFSTRYLVITKYFSLRTLSGIFQSIALESFKSRSGKNYHYSLGIESSGFDCQNNSRAFTFTNYSQNFAPIFNIQNRPFIYSGPAPAFNFSLQNKPVLSFWNDGNLNWNGTTTTVSQPGFSHFEIGDGGHVRSQYHTPILIDFDFTGNFEFGDNSLLFQFGKRKIDSHTWIGEISRIDSFGQKKWTFRDSLVTNYNSAKMDPVGNGLYTFETKDSIPKIGFLILNNTGNQIWKHTVSNSQNLKVLSLVKAVDTLEWAIGGTYLDSLDIGLPSSHLKAPSDQEINFVAYLSRQPNPGIYLGFDVKGKYCPGNEVQFDIDDQALVTDTNNRYLVEISDSSGSFFSPLILDSSKSVFKNFRLPNSVSIGGTYKIRIRSTFPDSIGPSNEIGLYPPPQEPIFFSNNGFYFCSGDSILLKISNPNSNAFYQWSDGRTADSIFVKTGGNFSVIAAIGTCLSYSDQKNVNVLPKIIAFPFDKTICGSLDSVKLITGSPGGYWTGNQIDSNGIFRPDTFQRTIPIRYRIKLSNTCFRDTTIIISQIIKPKLKPFRNNVLCQGEFFNLPSRGYVSPHWSGPKVSENRFYRDYIGNYKVRFEAGPIQCRASDSVTFMVKSPNHPFCKNGIDTLGILETMVEGKNCDVNGFRVWAGWSEFKSDTAGPFTLQIADSLGTFDLPILQQTQINPYFNIRQILPTKAIKIRVVNNRTMQIGPQKFYSVSMIPSTPFLQAIGLSTACTSTVGAIAKFFFNKVPYVEYYWNIVHHQVFLADTFYSNSPGSYAIRGKSFGCFGEYSNYLTIKLETLPNVTYFVPAKVCVNAPPFSLIATSYGTWSGPYVDSATRKFYPGPVADTSIIRYRLRVGDCFFTKDLQIIQMARPKIITDSSILFCPNFGSVPLVAIPPGGQWTGAGLLPNNRFFMQPPGVYPLIYSVTGGSSGCVSKDTVRISVQNPDSAFCQVSNSALENMKNLSFWPNPAQRQLFFSNGRQSELSIQIFNSLGQLVLSTSVFEKENPFNLPATISKGIYLLKVSNGETVLSEKLIIE